MASKKRSSQKKKSSTTKRTAKSKKTETKDAKKKAKEREKLMKKVVIKDIPKELKQRDGWETNKAQNVMTKVFNFTSFIAALAFVAKVAVHAEVLDHHPDIELSYGKVRVKLKTHATDSLTQLDLALADRIDSIKLKEVE